MLDLTAPAKYGAATEYEHWPKCARCSTALGRPYPVEHFGVVGREPSKMVASKYELVLELRCSHGEEKRVQLERLRNWDPRKLFGIAGAHNVGTGGLVQYKDDQCQRVRIEIPRAWGGVDLGHGEYQAPATEQVACSRVWAFEPGPPGKPGVTYRLPPASQKHRLETQVR